jgi:hypothetical protein
MYYFVYDLKLDLPAYCRITRTGGKLRFFMHRAWKEIQATKSSLLDFSYFKHCLQGSSAPGKVCNSRRENVYFFEVEVKRGLQFRFLEKNERLFQKDCGQCVWIFLKKSHQQTISSQLYTPGTDVMIFKILSPKNLVKNWRFWLKSKLFYSKFWSLLGFW